MTWSENVQNDSERQAFFVRASARIRIQGWTLHSGFIYKAPCTYGPVVSLKVNSEAYEEVASLSVLFGDEQYFYDRDEQQIYIWITGDANPESENTWVIPTFYLFYASQDTLWHETPDDDSTPIVEWKGLLSGAPEYRVTVPPLAMGYYPIEPTSLVIINDQSLNYILYHGSFHRTDCVVWQLAGALEEENFEMILNGLFGLTIMVDDDTISLQVLDRSIQFDGVVDLEYLGSSDVDPKFAGTPLMKLWGVPSVPGNDDLNKPVFELMNIDYDANAPTTSNNRKFALVYDPDSRYAETVVSGSIIAPGGSKRFRCNTSGQASKFRPGDKVWLDIGADEYFTIDTVSPGAGDVFFVEAVTAAGGTAGNLRTSFIKKVFLIQNGGETTYQLTFGRDYTETLHTGDKRGVTLTSSAESNVGAATFDPNTDSLWCNCVGHKIIPTTGALPATNVTDDTTYTEAFHHGINVLYDFLKRECDLSEDNIDLDGFETARGIVDWSVFLPVPFSQLTDAPTRRDVLDVILKSLMMRAFFNSEGKFTIQPYGPAETTAGTILREDIVSTNYVIDYSNMTKLVFVFVWDSTSINRIGYSGTKAEWLAGTAQIRFLTDQQINQVASAVGNAIGNHLHNVNKSGVVEHIVTNDGGDQEFQNRTLDLYNDRHGMMKVVTRRHFMPRSVGEDITVERPQMIGQVYTGADQTNVFEAIEVSKSQNSVEFQLDDTKAAKDAEDADYW